MHFFAEFIDLPPINAVSDGLAVSKLLSGMILVVRQDYCDQHALAEAMRQLEFLNVKLLGFVLNAADTQKNKYRYSGGYRNKKYYKSGYGYGYGSRYGQKSKMNIQSADGDEATVPSYDMKTGED